MRRGDPEGGDRGLRATRSSHGGGTRRRAGLRRAPARRGQAGRGLRTGCRPWTRSATGDDAPGVTMGAQLRVVRRRISSVQSTKKITRAMELIASSRIMRRNNGSSSRARMRSSSPRRWRTSPPPPGRCSITCSLDRAEPAPRGRVGGHVGPRPRRRLQHERAEGGRGVVREVRARGLEPVLVRRRQEGRRLLPVPGAASSTSWQGFSEVPAYDKAEEIGRDLIAAFAAGEIDELRCAYTDFRSRVHAAGEYKRFLPIAPEEVARDRRRDGRARNTCSSPSPSRSSTRCCPQYLSRRSGTRCWSRRRPRTRRGVAP